MGKKGGRVCIHMCECMLQGRVSVTNIARRLTFDPVTVKAGKPKTEKLKDGEMLGPKST